MRDIARRSALAQHARPSDTSSPASKLRALARQVERLGVGGRTDPEAITIAKLTVAHEMRQLAREIAP